MTSLGQRSDAAEFRKRFKWHGLFVVLVFMILVGRLFQLQVVQGADYQEAARENIIRRVTLATTRGVVRDQAQHKWEWLQELGEGLIVLSGAQAGPVGQALMRGDEAGAAAIAQRMASMLARGLSSSHRLAPSAASATLPYTHVWVIAMMAHINTICNHIVPWPGCRKRGNKASMNRYALGLSRQVTRPCRNVAACVRRHAGACRPKPSLLRSSDQPIQAR